MVCKQPNHGNKLQEFICKRIDCKNRFLCSVCLIENHHDHIQQVILIEKLLNEIHSPRKKRNQKKCNQNQIEDLVKNKKDLVEQFCQQQESKNQLNLKQISEIEAQILDELQLKKNNFRSILENQEIRVQELSQLLTERYKKKEIQISDIVIENLSEFKQYVNQKFSQKEQNEPDQQMNLPQEYFELLLLLNFHPELNVQKLKNFKELLKQVFNFSIDHLYDYAFCKMKQYIPYSSFDCQKLINIKSIETQHKKSIYQVQFLENQRKLITASDDSTLQVYSISQEKHLKTLSGHTDRIWELIKLSDDQLATCSSDQKIRIWSLKSFSCVKVLSGHTGFVCALLELPNKTLVSGSHDKSMRVWNYKEGQCIKIIKGDSQGKIMCICLLNGLEIACGSDSNINIYDMQHSNILNTLKGHTGLLRNLLLLENMQQLLSASDDKTIRLWNLSTLEVIRVYSGHSHSANRIIMWNSETFLSTSDDSTIKFWKIDQSTVVQTLKGHESWVINANIMNDGQLVTVGWDKKIRFWKEQLTQEQ